MYIFIIKCILLSVNFKLEIKLYFSYNNLPITFRTSQRFPASDQTVLPSLLQA